MDSIFTLDEFPVAMSSISRRVANLQVALPVFPNLSCSQKSAMQADMQAVAELIQKLEVSLKSVKKQQLIYRKCKTQLDQAVTRFNRIVAAFHSEEQSLLEEEADEQSSLLHSAQRSFDAEVACQLTTERGLGISRVATALQTVNSMIREFGEMVHEQASKVNTLEEFIESTTHRSQLALAQIEKANQRDKASRTHKGSLCLLASMALGCFVLTSLTL